MWGENSCHDLIPNPRILWLKVLFPLGYLFNSFDDKLREIQSCKITLIHLIKNKFHRIHFNDAKQKGRRRHIILQMSEVGMSLRAASLQVSRSSWLIGVRNKRAIAFVCIVIVANNNIALYISSFICQYMFWYLILFLSFPCSKQNERSELCFEGKKSIVTWIYITRKPNLFLLVCRVI